MECTVWPCIRNKWKYNFSRRLLEFSALELGEGHSPLCYCAKNISVCSHLTLMVEQCESDVKRRNASAVYNFPQVIILKFLFLKPRRKCKTITSCDLVMAQVLKPNPSR